MRFVFSPQDEAFRKEVKDFYKKELPAGWYGGYDERDEQHHFIESVRKKLAAKKWLTMSWPKEYGGSEAPVSAQLVFAEESAYYRFYARDAGVGYLGPAIMRHGTPEQKGRFLGPIARAEINFHQGFSEPDAGSDLAGLKTKATRDGDDFVINGAKIWGGHLHLADYSFLLARSDPSAPKHQGVTFFIIPAKTPGIRYEEFGNLGGGNQNIVYYDNCRVNAKDCVIGEVNQGWYLATTLLNHERVVIEHAATNQRLLEEIVAYWKAQGYHNRHDPQTEVLRHKLADMAVQIETCRMMAYRIGWLQSIGQAPTFEASEVKIFGSELTQRFAQVAVQVLSLYGQVERHTSQKKYVRVDGRTEHNYRQQLMFSIVGGANEIQRGLIANRGLGLPRA